MKRRLFFTGDIGVGKSTAIAAALGTTLEDLGGFLTRRNLDHQGRITSFSLETPDGKNKGIFLDFSSGQPQVHTEVFENLGIAALAGNLLILDEIGGVEILSPVFWDALEKVLKSQVPILGVIKGENSSLALMKALGLTEEYRRQADRLWNLISFDEDTMLHTCEKNDEKALSLAKQWVREYCL